ncbi:MAG: NAD(P)-dependent oxidoreductase, partial [bacterium]
MIKIAVTDLEYDKAKEVFANAEGFECVRTSSDEEILARTIREQGISHAVVGVRKYTSSLYEALPEGGVIARFGVGYDGLDLRQASERGILCCNTPGVLDQSVAECAVGLMLDAARHVARCACELRTGNWQNRVGTELAGKTLAVIGCGAIGRRVAKIAKHGFGMHVLGHDIQAVDDPVFDETPDDFASAVAEAHVVSLHIPDIPATSDFINAERLALLRSDAILVNTARGGILDEDALFDAVESGRL